MDPLYRNIGLAVVGVVIVAGCYVGGVFNPPKIEAPQVGAVVIAAPTFTPEPPDPVFIPPTPPADPKRPLRGAVAQRFDLASLIGLDAKAVEAKLGAPAPSQAPASDSGPVRKTWKAADGSAVVVTFDATSGRVSGMSFTLPESLAGPDADTVLQAGNLSSSDPRYTLTILQINRDKNRKFGALLKVAHP